MPIARVNSVALYHEVTGAGAPLVLPVPTLLLVGEHDEPCVKVHRFMADRIRPSKLVVLPGLGHLTNLEAPAAWNAAVRRFLAG